MDKKETKEAITPPGVAIYELPTGKDGEYKIEVQEIGGIDPLAVPTLLRVAAKLKEQSLLI